MYGKKPRKVPRKFMMQLQKKESKPETYLKKKIRKSTKRRKRKHHLQPQHLLHPRKRKRKLHPHLLQLQHQHHHHWKLSQLKKIKIARMVLNQLVPIRKRKQIPKPLKNLISKKRLRQKNLRTRRRRKKNKINKKRMRNIVKK